MNSYFEKNASKGANQLQPNADTFFPDEKNTTDNIPTVHGLVPPPQVVRPKQPTQTQQHSIRPIQLKIHKL